MYYDFSWSPDNQYLGGVRTRQKGLVELWDLETSELVSQFDDAYDFSWLPDGNFFTVLVDTLSLFDELQTWQLDPMTLVTQREVSGAVAISRSYHSQYLDLCNTENYVIYDKLQSESFVTPLDCPGNRATFAYSPNGLVAFAYPRNNDGVIDFFHLDAE